MNKSPINRFYFRDDCESKSTNYPGLIDAIYIIFFNDHRHKQTNILLELLENNCEDDSSGLMPEDSKHKGYHDSELGDSNVLDSECAHLNFYDKNNIIGSLTTISLRIPIDVEKSSFSCKSQGQSKGITYLSDLNVTLKERSSKVSELQHALTHTGFKLGVFFRDANGDTRLLADPHYDMKVETSDESGEGPSGSSSASLKFSQVSKIPPIYYRGKLYFNDNNSSSSSTVGFLICESGYTTLNIPDV